MQGFSYLGMALFVLVAAIEGGRLVIAGCRARDAARGLIGGALLGAGGIGPLLPVAASAIADGRPELVPILWPLGLLSINAGAVCLALFTRRVFHPDSGMAGAIAALAIAALVACFVGHGVVSGFDRVGLFDAWGYAGLGLRIAIFGWASVASAREGVRAAKRVRLGLTSREIADRFRLWGVASGAAAAVFATNLIRNVVGDNDPSSVVGLTVIPALGIVAACAITLAFHPPRAYRRWIEGATAV